MNNQQHNVSLPPALYAIWKQFEIDKLRGNVQLNFKDGRIVGFRVETVHSVQGDTPVR